MVFPFTNSARGVKVGWFGSQVAIRTIVAEGRGVAVSVLVGVSIGVNVKGGVDVGSGARVDGTRSAMEQAVNSNAMNAKINFFRIECLIPL